MGILTFLEAILKLGIPMVILSWFIFTWLYGGGEIDRDADRKSISAQVKKMKKSFKNKEGGKANYVYDKWMWFGSGFYGLAGLWTFAVIEIVDVFRLILNPSMLSTAMNEGLIALVIDVLMNQLGNVITAFIWFSYWTDDGIIAWILVAYFGYWAGIELARRGDDLPIQEWIRKVKSLRP